MSLITMTSRPQIPTAPLVRGSSISASLLSFLKPIIYDSEYCFKDLKACIFPCWSIVKIFISIVSFSSRDSPATVSNPFNYRLFTFIGYFYKLVIRYKAFLVQAVGDPVIREQANQAAVLGHYYKYISLLRFSA